MCPLADRVARPPGTFSPAPFGKEEQRELFHMLVALPQGLPDSPTPCPTQDTGV